jgi:DNA-binding response OmpR family regulator
LCYTHYLRTVLAGAGFEMKVKILAIDDEKDILRLVSYNLNKEGFETTTSTNGKDSLNLIKTKNLHSVYDFSVL